MKLLFSTLSIAVLMAISMAVANSFYGAHSTPSIRLATANLPGVVVATWSHYFVETSVPFYVICALANWAFYFYVSKGAFLLRRKLSTDE
jgi:hypothetical protein